MVVENTAKYRKLHKKFWSDPRVRELNDKEKLLFIYCVNGIEACSNTNSSGIYELHRSSFQNYFGWHLDDIDNILESFNRKHSDLLEYNFENHIVYVKSFFKYNGKYKTGIDALAADFEETYRKAPDFWRDFGQRYRERLNKNFNKLENDAQLFLCELFSLKDKPQTDIKIGKSSSKKLLSANSLNLEQ